MKDSPHLGSCVCSKTENSSDVSPISGVKARLELRSHVVATVSTSVWIFPMSADRANDGIKICTILEQV